MIDENRQKTNQQGQNDEQAGLQLDSSLGRLIPFPQDCCVQSKELRTDWALDFTGTVRRSRLAQASQLRHEPIRGES
jgi:hypothetical protein